VKRDWKGVKRDLSRKRWRDRQKDAGGMERRREG